jgi:hypothetical protein
MSEQNAREEAAAAIKQANKASRRGDLAAAERWSKTAERMAQAAERLAAIPEPIRHDEEAQRAELRRRIARFVEASQAGASDDELDRIGAGDY